MRPRSSFWSAPGAERLREQAERGVGVDEIEIEAVGDTDPLTTAERTEQEWIDRSMTFELGLAGWHGGEGARSWSRRRSVWWNCS